MATHVGPAGWSYEDWKGTVYPKGAPARFDQLAYLTEYFDAIEINSTFYRPATPAMAKSWARRAAVRPDFKFTAKLGSQFTHEKTAWSPQDVTLFKAGLAPLQEAGMLGALLIQFPWSFKNFSDARDRLTKLAEAFRAFPLVLEVRHASWDRPEVFQFLRDEKIGFCNIDQPVIGDSLKPTGVVTSDVGYFRLHGRNYANWFKKDAGRDARYDYLYSPQELDSLMVPIDNIQKAAPETYVITNNHYRGQAACNALEIKNRLEGQPVPVPEPLRATYPRLDAIAAR